MERHIHDDDNDIRLDRWFKRHMANVPHVMLQKSLRKGLVRLDGKKAEANTRLQEGQKLTMPDEWRDMPAEERGGKRKNKVAISESAINDLEQMILFEDDFMLVLNKPAGLAVQGGTGQKENVDDILRARAERKRQDPPKLVHRLDKDTSGLLVLGKTANAAAELAQAFARKKVEKFYWALVLRVPSVDAGVIDMPLTKKATGKDSKYEKVQGDDDGKNAVTNYQIVQRAGQKLAWLELLPVTGRTHQLRVHMAGIGHPILGDGKYGGSEAFFEGDSIPKKLHLHARKLVIPLQTRTLTFEAPLTGHMKKSWELFQFGEPKIRKQG